MFHSYPYKSRIPVTQNGKLPIKIFRSDEDVWDVIQLIIAETKEINNMGGKSFDIATSISQQLPHFCCSNIIINKESQNDISRYIYCKEFNLNPIHGTYNEQPKKWIQKVNIIKDTMQKREEIISNRLRREAEQKAGK